MILVFGGTTEGRIAIKKLEEAGNPYYYSTRGDEQEVVLHHGTRLIGAMDVEQLKAFCQEHAPMPFSKCNNTMLSDYWHLLVYKPYPN